MSFFSIVAKGGWLMVAIFICSLVAVAIIVERWISLHKAKINAHSFFMEIKGLILKGDITEAIERCRKTPGPVTSILRAGIERYDQTKEEIKEAVESSGKMEVHNLERYLGVLATIAAVAPLLGFLGTVTGMIKAFMRIEALGGNVNASVLAGGIWEALVTTASGLTVGIPVLIFYNYFQGKVDRFVYEMEESSSKLLEALSKRGG
jgi:biopolymer transport protein ExbB